jgi:rare lipoprotein A (peptidoglycan hydrolase)
VQARVERALVARLGTVAFAVALGLPAVIPSASARPSVVVAGAVEATIVTDAVARVAVDASSIVEQAELRLPPPAIETEVASASVEDPAPAPIAAPVVAVPTFPPPEPLVMDGFVIASWYGPGFYGNRTACGQTYTPEIMGVAHRTLPCGTQIRISSPAGVTLVAPVIDRGPYIAGRSLDLSNATRAALSCSDLCRVRVTVLN